MIAATRSASAMATAEWRAAEAAMKTARMSDLLSVEQVTRKYRLCTEDLLAETKIQESIRMTLGLEELDNVAKLMEAVANPKC